MQRRRSRMLAVVLTTLMVSAGCGDEDGGQADEVSLTGSPAATTTTTTTTLPSTTTLAATTTLPTGPPCFGLVQVDKLPDWAGGLAFGEKHDLPGRMVDLRSSIGCEVEEGVLIVGEDGLLRVVFAENCDSFESSDIPSQELRPAADETWICQDLTEEGWRLMLREG